MILPRLLLLTDRRQLPRRRDLVSNVADCLEHGLTHVVLRELDLPDSERADLAAHLADLGATVISARRPLSRCVGVHVAATAPAPASGPWGRSCHSAFDVRHAAGEGASWALLSPFAASRSKRPRAAKPLPASAFAGHQIPVYALGGVEPDNAGGAVAAGAYGVAVMGAVMRARRPGPVVSRLLDAVT